jgi:hypothetical protein
MMEQKLGLLLQLNKVGQAQKTIAHAKEALNEEEYLPLVLQYKHILDLRAQTRQKLKEKARHLSLRVIEGKAS